MTVGDDLGVCSKYNLLAGGLCMAPVSLAYMKKSQCSTPVNADSFDAKSEPSDMHIDLHFSMISNSSVSVTSEASPSKDLRRKRKSVIQTKSKMSHEMSCMAIA